MIESAQSTTNNISDVQKQHTLRVNDGRSSEGWDNVAKDLSAFGIALVGLEHATVQSHSIASTFATARCVFDTLDKHKVLSTAHSLPSSESSAHSSGYHGAGRTSSKSNLFREGYVFSDACHSVEVDGHPNFAPSCSSLFSVLYEVATLTLSAIQRNEQNSHLKLLLPNHRRESCSQWHLKRYHLPKDKTIDSESNPSLLWLPTHMDPSLVSVVIHDRPPSSPGGAGFQFWFDKAWHQIPVSGHNIAIVLVGSVLPVYRPCRHRVRMLHRDKLDSNSEGRMAATLFLRPAPEELLPNGRTYGQWLERTARRYDASK